MEFVTLGVTNIKHQQLDYCRYYLPVWTGLYQDGVKASESSLGTLKSSGALELHYVTTNK